MDIEADFSKPGEIAVPFQQTCSISHGESVCLQITPPLDELYEPAQLLDDLSGRIVIRDSTGREIERGVFGATTIRRRAAGETIVLTDFAPFATGDYVVTVSVDQGSPELKDRRQRLYAEYNLCGLEQLPALIAGAFSLGAGMIGFLTALCVIPGLTRHGFRVADPRASGDQAGAEF